MKRLISLLLCVMLLAVLAVPAAAAGETARIAEINRYWGAELRGTQLYEYDKKGRVSAVEIWDYDSEEPSCTLIACTYDKNGNPKK